MFVVGVLACAAFLDDSVAGDQGPGVEKVGGLGVVEYLVAAVLPAGLGDAVVAVDAVEEPEQLTECDLATGVGP